MRKLKDLGKRMLVMVLAVSMFITLIPGMPVRAADNFPTNGTIALGADANGAVMSGSSYVYTGQEVRPAVTVTVDGVTLTENQDYHVTYLNNVNAGQASIDITGIGAGNNWQTTRSFTIAKQSLEHIGVTYQGVGTVGNECYVYYTGSDVFPTITYVYGIMSGTDQRITLSPDDYAIDYTPGNNTSAGKHSFRINLKPTSNYSFSGNLIERTYNIYYNMASDTVTVENLNDVTYNGSAQCPAYTLRDSQNAGFSEHDYTAVWSNNTNAGTASLTISANTSNAACLYQGSKTFHFNIKPADIKDAVIEFKKDKYYYIKNSRPDLTSELVVKLGGVVIDSSNYTYTYLGNNAGGVGLNNLQLTGTGNLSGNRYISFNIYDELGSASLSSTTLEYTGKVNVPVITVKNKYDETITDTNYTVTYYSDPAYQNVVTDPTNIGRYYVNIKVKADGANFYEGELGTPTSPISFDIVAKSLDKCTFTLYVNGTLNGVVGAGSYSGYYDGASKNLSLTGEDDEGNALSSPTDFTYDVYTDAACTNAAADVRDAGTYYVKIVGTQNGNYAGSEKIFSYVVEPKSINPTRIVITPQTYTGAAVVPDPANITVAYKDSPNGAEKTIESSNIEVVSCSNNIAIGTAQATIRLTGNYRLMPDAADTVSFQIVPRKLSDCDWKLIDERLEYNGTSQVPRFSITDNNGAKILVQGIDYQVTYFTDPGYNSTVQELVNAGTYYIQVIGLGIYENTDLDARIRTSFEIYAKDMSGLTVTASNMAYTGNEVNPVITVRDGNRVLNQGTDYTLEGYYSDKECTVPSTHTDSGQVYVKLQAVAGSNYSGTATAGFFIGTNIANAADVFTVSGGTYNRASHKSAIIAAIRSRMMEKGITDDSYEVTLFADEGRQTDITGADENNDYFVNAGRVYYRISGKRAYYGNVDGIATINKKNIGELYAQVIGQHTYDELGQNVPISTSLDTDGVILQWPVTNGYILTADDYEIELNQNTVNAGSAVLTLKAKEDGNYTGTKQVTYTIVPKDLHDVENLTVNVSSAVFADRRHTPGITVTYGSSNRLLQRGTDYAVSYFRDENFRIPASDADLTNAGTTYVRIEGVGNYKGLLTTAEFDNGTLKGSNKFVINPLDIQNVAISLNGREYMFSYNIPSFTVTQSFAYESGSGNYEYMLQSGRDYTYDPVRVDEFRVGQQSVTVTGQGNFTGRKTVNFYYRGNIADQVEVILGETTVNYDPRQAAGSGMTVSSVSVHVKGNDQLVLQENADYTVTYQNNKVPGRADVIITGREGNYWVGTYTAHFDIVGSISDAEITIPTQVYTGREYNTTTQPIQNMQVTFDGKTLVEGVDYKVKSVVNAREVSSTAPTVIIEGNGTYFTGEKSATFAIKYDINSVNVDIALAGTGVYTYTGSPIEPGFSVNYYVTSTSFVTLERGTDYTVSYINNIEVARANGESGPCVVIEATPDGKLTPGTRYKAFTIDAIHMADYEIIGVNDSYTYTGKLIKPNTLQVKKIGSNEIMDPANYDIYYQTNAEDPNSAPAGSVETITVVGKGNYEGQITKELQITSLNLANTTYHIEDQTYTGEELRPEVTFRFNDENGQEQTLVIEKDYVVEEYRNNVNAAQSNGVNAPYARVRGVGSCIGGMELFFTIQKRNMEDLIYSEVEDPQYVPMKTNYEPEFQVYMSSSSSEPLEKDVVYTAKYFNNDRVRPENGTSGPYILITPKDTVNYTGSHTIPFGILPRDLSSDNIEGTLSDASDSGFDPVNRNYPYEANRTYTPSLSLRDRSENGAVPLISGTDYTYRYVNNNVGVATAYIEVTGMGNYTGTRIERFTIGTLLAPSTVTVTGISDTVYNGLDTTPKNIKVRFNRTGEDLILDQDYTIKYYKDPDCLIEASAVDRIHAGMVYVAIIGSENEQTGYVGTVVIPYEIARKSLTSTDITVSGIEDMNYTGSALIPDLTLRDSSTGLEIDSTQYTVTYENNVEIGTASATITATDTGNYKDSITVYYKITKYDINRVWAEAIPDQAYTGDYIRPALTIYDGGKLLTEGVDYEVVNGNNLRAGESWVIIKGLGNYDKTKRVYFNIIASLEGALIDDIPEQMYMGRPVTPSIKVACGSNTLVLGRDYTVTYANNNAVGDASVTIRPLSKYYTGTIVKKFRISNSISYATVSGVPSSVMYTGNAFTPEVTVSYGGIVLTKGIDYTVSYTNNVRVGTAGVVIQGIGIYSGQKTIPFRILEKSIANCTIYAVASQSYTGKPQTPPVVVKDGSTALVNGRDYTLTYRNNVNVGIGYVIITGAGDYKGSATRSFNIVQPVPVSNVMVQNRNTAAGTFDIVVDGVASYLSNVQVPVWSRADQSDIVWYNASRVDADTFIVHADIHNHQNNTGIYNIHVYVSGPGIPLQVATGTIATVGGGYEHVFDYGYYMMHQPDVANAYGNNTQAVFEHFLQYGMKEGRQASAEFNVHAYRAGYRDLRAAYGSNLSAYYMHYINYGRAEGRIATGSTVYQNALTVYNGVDYALVYDYNYYINKYPDVKAAFNGDDEATLRHFVTYGMNEGRQAKETFNVGTYLNTYADLRTAYGGNLPAYYMHYIIYGYRENRTAS